MAEGKKELRWTVGSGVWDVEFNCLLTSGGDRLKGSAADSELSTRPFMTVYIIEAGLARENSFNSASVSHHNC